MNSTISEPRTGQSGRLRFSVPTRGIEETVRLLVLDEGGRIVRRSRVSPTGASSSVLLRGFPRGQRFLVCAFAGDELIWSAPVTAG